MEKDWAHSVDHCQLQAFLVHLIDLLSILLRCNGFAGIQTAAVDQTGSDHQAVTVTSLWCKFGFGKWFGAASWSLHSLIKKWLIVA